MYSVTKTFEFEAAHHLPNYGGKCHNLHGHSYKLEVTIEGEKLDEQGMLVDFSRLKNIVNKYVVGQFDHSNLNDTFPVPTAEIMCEQFYFFIGRHLKDFGRKPSSLSLKKVRLWETSSSYAEYRGELENED